VFPNRGDINKEYARLLRKFGEGESACMAVARFENKYIASSNLKDIKSYCVEHEIVYYTTMDILLEGLNQRILSEEECDQFIFDVKSKGSKLPCDSMLEYLRRNKG
jgi:hypothetical protein